MKFHIANTNFEEELAASKPTAYVEALKNHPLYRQLQFLPLLYADPHDAVLVTELPPQEFEQEGFPKLYTFSDALKSPSHLESWGYSEALQEVAKEKRLAYECPSLATVRKIHSKAFSQEHAPKHANSTLLYNEKEALDWLKNEPYPKVLKKTLSHGGRGHYLLLSSEDLTLTKILPFLEKEWQEGRPVRSERWLVRIFEFSTQWWIERDSAISLLGSTVFESSARGSYQNTLIGDKKVLFGEYLPFLEEHLEHARSFLGKVASEGYFGNIGLDALIYRSGEEISLYPITEANARKTMSYAALLFQKRHYPEKVVNFSYLTSKQNGKPLLPSYLVEKNGRKISFQKQLFCEVLTHL